MCMKKKTLLEVCNLKKTKISNVCRLACVNWESHIKTSINIRVRALDLNHVKKQNSFQLPVQMCK